MSASFAAVRGRRSSFFMIRFVLRGCRYSKSLPSTMRSLCPYIQVAPDRRMALRSLKKWRTLYFIILISAQRLQLDHPVVAGASFGGWIAAEWAMRYSKTLRALILIDALGLRVADAPAPDILSLDPAASRQAIFADPSSALALEVIPETPKPEEIVSVLLARQTLARFAWQFPDNPRLLRYLYRIAAPTLILWGERDGFVSSAHGQAYHEGIAGSEFSCHSKCRPSAAYRIA